MGTTGSGFAVVEPPQEHVVIAVLVAVPGHVDIALAVGGDGRGPMVGRFLRHGDRLVPPAAPPVRKI